MTPKLAPPLFFVGPLDERSNAVGRKRDEGATGTPTICLGSTCASLSSLSNSTRYSFPDLPVMVFFCHVSSFVSTLILVLNRPALYVSNVYAWCKDLKMLIMNNAFSIFGPHLVWLLVCHGCMFNCVLRKLPPSLPPTILPPRPTLAAGTYYRSRSRSTTVPCRPVHSQKSVFSAFAQKIYYDTDF